MKFLAFCEGSPYGVRIASFLKAYGAGYPFALFWMQTDGFGGMTAAVSRIDGNATVCAAEKANLEELWAFLAAIGFESVLCPEWTALKEKLPPGCRLQRCLPMRLHQPCVQGGDPLISISREPTLQQVYGLLRAVGEPLPGLEAWLPDVSHRVRHGAACVWAARHGTALAACAMAVALTQREALLGGVAVLPEQRGNGIGSSLASSLCKALYDEGRIVFLFREEGRHEAFYRRIGFLPHREPALLITKKGV